MKVAYFIDFPKGLGGAGNVLVEQARLMSEIYEVVVVIPCDEAGIINSEYEIRCKRAKLHYTGLLYKTSTSPKNIDIISSFEALSRVKDFLLCEKVDLIHTVQLNTTVEFAARELGIPHLMNIYQIDKHEFVFDKWDIYPKYHSCDSELYCDIWNRLLGVHSLCIRPVAPLPHIVERKHIIADKMKLLMLGSVCQRKNQLAAIRAVEKCNRIGLKIELTIAGSYIVPYAEQCVTYIESRGLKDIVHMIGFVSDIENLLQKHDCYLCTSMNESFPSSIVEAMTYDMTVISTPVAGVPEIMINDKNAFISQDFTVDAIVKSIEDCYKGYVDGSIYNIHRKAMQTWEANFKPQIIQQQLRAYYEDIYNDKKIKQIPTTICEIIEEIRQMYDILSVANAEDIILSSCMYYHCLKEKIDKGTAYIWGAGNYGYMSKKVLDILFPQVKVLAFIDSHKKGQYLGLPIIIPEQIDKKQVDYVFLGFASERDEVMKYLEDKEFVSNETIWTLI